MKIRINPVRNLKFLTGVNQKYLLLTLSGLLMVGVIFSVVQVILAGTATLYTKDNPGHNWGEIANFSCPANEYLMSKSGGTSPVLTCGAEIDPQVGTLTSGMWCTTNGTQVNCTSSAPTGGISGCYNYSSSQSGTVGVNGCIAANTNTCNYYNSGTFMTGGGCQCLESESGEVVMGQNYGYDGGGGNAYWVCSCCRTAGSGSIQTIAWVRCCK